MFNNEDEKGATSFATCVHPKDAYNEVDHDFSLLFYLCNVKYSIGFEKGDVWFSDSCVACGLLVFFFMGNNI